MQVVERSQSALALRMDDRRQRLFVDASNDIGARVFGWEVADANALDRFAARLDAAGISVRRELASLADRRRVAGLVSFEDPAGNRLELFHGSQIADTLSKPGRSTSGFRTGALGVGHIVLTAKRADDVVPSTATSLAFG